MSVYECATLGESYPHLLKKLLKNGKTVESRAGAVREILGFTLRIHSPRFCVVDRDGFSRAFLDEEVLQLLAGVHDNERLRRITPVAADLITPHTAYGPRTWEQLDSVEAELRDDPNSRRGVVYVGRDTDLIDIGDSTAGEMPCTCIWQFLVRSNELHMIVYMRSWDAVWGLVYDVPSFVAVQMAMAKALGRRVGQYQHTAGSFHIYDRHWRIEARSCTTMLEIPYLHGTMADTRSAAQGVIDASS
jgi:thymidylate synthase